MKKNIFAFLFFVPIVFCSHTHCSGRVFFNRPITPGPQGDQKETRTIICCTGRIIVVKNESVETKSKKKNKKSLHRVASSPDVAG